MYKLAFILIVAVLSGCATGPKVAPKTEQICSMRTDTEVIRNSAGVVVSSRTIEHMVCNDNQIDRLFQSQSGMAANCGTFTYQMNMGGRRVWRKGVSCQKPNGSWEIVNTSQW